MPFTNEDAEHAATMRKAFLSGVGVVGVIGGPGAGKGTQSELLAKRFGVKHISIGDMMRKEKERNPSLAAEIAECHRTGSLGRVEMTGEVLIREMLAETCVYNQVFVLDDCCEKTMVQRIMERSQIARSQGEAQGQESRRSDDQDPESIKGRIKTFREETGAVIELFKGRNAYMVIDGEGSTEEVWNRMEQAFRERLLQRESTN